MLRIRSMRIEDFKNVEVGSIALSSISSVDDMGSGAEVTGIYGQNGSGKTSFIQALAILESLMRGETLDSHASEYVRAGSGSLKICAELFVAAGDDEALSDYIMGDSDTIPAHIPYLVKYEVCIGSLAGKAPVVISESLSCKDLNSDEDMHKVLAWSAGEAEDARSASDNPALSLPISDLSWAEDVDEGWRYVLSGISPSTYWQSLLAVDSELATRLRSSMNQAFESGGSFVFSRGFLSFARVLLNEPDRNSNRKVSKVGAKALSRILVPAINIVISCRIFAMRDMVVLDTSHQGYLPLGVLPLSSHEGRHGEYLDNFMVLDISKPSHIDAARVSQLKHTLVSISDVIGALVPGLRVEVDSLGELRGDNGERLESIELMSVRGATRVPLRNESEGIQKILSIVSLLVDVHTNPATFVAIDELDAGVFEYLLGEILQTISRHGCGQLVFTAHNLRPLEVLDNASIWLTTTNPSRCYVRMRGARDTNNARKAYLRDIRLGGEHDSVYVPTSPQRIDAALYGAGAFLSESRRALRG